MNINKIITVILILMVSCIFTIINADSSFMKIEDTVEIDSDITINLYLDNIKYDNFTFKLYSSESLESISAKDIDFTNSSDAEISFDFCINCSKMKTLSLNYKLPSSVSIGDNITFYALIINKDNTEESEEYRKTVLVTDKQKEDKNETNETTDKNSRHKNNFSGGNFNRVLRSNTNGSSGVSTKYKGSTNNYLSNIAVKGYTLNKKFTKERLTYFVTVPNNVKSLNIQTSKESSKSVVNISGNSNFEVGLNKVLITVTAEDGRVKNYRLYVTRLDSDTNEE